MATIDLTGTTERMARAREIILHPEEIERLSDTEWSVPSQSGFGRYRVELLGVAEGRCSCPDFSKRTLPCKHILAAWELRLRESGQSLELPAKKPRKQYAQHPTYTRGQTEEMRLVDSLLRDLVSAVPDMPRPVGLPGPAPTPFRDDLYCAVLKVYSGLSARRAHGVHLNVADRGLLARAPSYAVSSNCLNRPEATAVLYRLLTLSALPLAGLEDGGAISPDSTGVQTTSFGGWREEKHGEKRTKHWLKVHAIVGTKTHVVIGALVGGANSADSPQFAPLLRGALEAGFKPAMVPADKGYLSRDNYQLAADLGLQALIPFKSNSIPDAGGVPRLEEGIPSLPGMPGRVRCELPRQVECGVGVLGPQEKVRGEHPVSDAGRPSERGLGEADLLQPVGRRPRDVRARHRAPVRGNGSGRVRMDARFSVNRFQSPLGLNLYYHKQRDVLARIAAMKAKSQGAH